MWRLKLSHLFGGYGHYVLIATALVMPISLLFSVTDGLITDIILGFAIALVAPGLIVYIFQNFMPDVREKVHSASEPDWRHLEPYEYKELLGQQIRKSGALKILLYVQAPLLFVGLTMIVSGKPMIFLIMELIIVTTAVTHIVITRLIGAKWVNVDGSAEIAEIAIEETYTVTTHGKYSTSTVPYYVYYLPSGRYVVDEKQLYTGSTVKIVRWAGSYIYLRS